MNALLFFREIFDGIIANMNKPIVYMMLGLPGSGKTTYSKNLQKKLGLPRFSIDEEYFQLVGNKQQEHRDFEIEKMISEQIKKKIIKLLAKSNSVILDFCPWTKLERKHYKQFLEEHGAKCQIIYFDVPKEELLRRLENRNKEANQKHQYMTPAMLNDFYERFESPDNEEIEVIKF